MLLQSTWHQDFSLYGHFKVLLSEQQWKWQLLPAFIVWQPHRTKCESIDTFEYRFVYSRKKATWRLPCSQHQRYDSPSSFQVPASSSLGSERHCKPEYIVGYENMPPKEGKGDTFKVHKMAVARKYLSVLPRPLSLL